MRKSELTSRKIEPSNQFRRDYKRETKGQHREFLADGFSIFVEILAADRQLGQRYRDHAMIGNWKDHRNCHIRPDLVLIYQKPDAETLRLVRLGSHAELGI